MSSILCRNCGKGIHYHSEPQGIQYVYISFDKWNEICKSAFNPYAQDIVAVSYPKLFRTDTIEDDFEDDIVKVWRCPECGCVMSFEGEGKVKNSFMVSSDKYLGSTYEEGIAFDDYLWDEITEGAKPNNAMQTQSPSFYVKICEMGCVVSPDKSFSNPICYKKME